MKKIKDKKGFILAEAVITSVFVLGIFTFVLANVFPLIGKYERTLKFDNLEDVFIANNVREIFDNCGITPKIQIGIHPVNTFCSVSNTGLENFCNEALGQLNVDKIIVPTLDNRGPSAHIKLNAHPLTSNKSTRAIKAYARYFNNNNTCDNTTNKVVIIKFVNSDSNNEITYSSFCVKDGE